MAVKQVFCRKIRWGRGQRMTRVWEGSGKALLRKSVEGKACEILEMVKHYWTQETH